MNSNKYIYYGITYYLEKFKYNDYEVSYKLYYEKCYNHIILKGYSFEEEIIFSSKYKQDCRKIFYEWFCDIVESHKVISYIRKGYNIYYDFPSILKSVRDISVGYHITELVNKPFIDTQGIVPNGNEDVNVSQASFYIDKEKFNRIPSWVQRYNAVYAHPEFNNTLLINNSHLINNALFAINLNTDFCWVGSQGIGAFSLFDDSLEENEEDRLKHIHSIHQYGKWYWKGSCSLNSYIAKNSSFKRANKVGGLDEILIFHPITPENIVFLGYWNEDGQFIESNKFMEFLKVEYVNNYKEVLSRY